MKIPLSTLVLCAAALTLRAASTIDSANRSAYGANLGWMDWRADTTNGAVIGEYVCSGSIYSANAGWINLGGGAPTNGIYYQNLSPNDFGVNQDGLGNLRGYAWGANIGWINFESTGAPQVDLNTGNLTGYVWSANCGWISLSNAAAYVQTDAIRQGMLAANGLPVAWLLANFGTTNVDASADPDHDGMSNLREYLAGTNPNNSNDCLSITAFSTAPSGTSATVTWKSVPSRRYYIEESLNLNAANWFDCGLGSVTPSTGPTTTSSLTNTNAPVRFYRVQAVQPLMP